jgi:transposase-like protein
MPRPLWKCVHCGKEFATEAGCEAHEKDCKATLRDTVEDLKSRVRRLERTVVMYGVWTDDSTFANDGNTYTTRTSINVDED